MASRQQGLSGEAKSKILFVFIEIENGTDIFKQTHKSCGLRLMSHCQQNILRVNTLSLVDLSLYFAAGTLSSTGATTGTYKRLDIHELMQTRKKVHNCDFDPF